MLSLSSLAFRVPITMTETRFPDSLVETGGGSILLLVLDGLGGLPHPETGLTELESARTPHLDALASRSSLGMMVPVLPGITPGSGPGHLSLFGYDPIAHQVGRGALSALGVGFDLAPGDLAVRLNLATLDGEGRVTDRRAGRPSDEVGRRVVGMLRDALQPPGGVELFMHHEKEHRAVLILRGGEFREEVQDTDPQEVGVPPLPPRALIPEAGPTEEVLTRLLGQARDVLRNEERVTGVLARGFASFHGFPSLEERFRLRGVAVARYPMYRGVARLVGMESAGEPGTDEEAVALLQRVFGEYDFHFLHFKAPDARGEDRDFEAKVRAVEEADALLPSIEALQPEVLIVTGDHSTPAGMGTHSWHSVPVLLHSRWGRPSAGEFGETVARAGDLGTFEAKHLMSLALAHAGRLRKFGA